MSRFTRQDAVRILHLRARDLRNWERAGLVSPRDEYSFGELGELRTLRDLRARHIPTRSIRRALDAMFRLAGMRNALREVSATPATAGAPNDRRLHFRHNGSLVEPLTQQLVFDFDRTSAGPTPSELPRPAEPRLLPAHALQELFLQAVRMEETGNISDAIDVYEHLLQQRPDHAPTLINLGTIRYNQRSFEQAEQLYLSATLADPRYALAFFDLGNVLDEMGRLPEATAAYTRAVALVPHYADAHYNLALAFERQGQRRRALRHWLMYIRLDPVGPWSAHARSQARRTLKAEKLSIVSRRGRLVQAG